MAGRHAPEKGLFCFRKAGRLLIIFLKRVARWDTGDIKKISDAFGVSPKGETN